MLLARRHEDHRTGPHLGCTLWRRDPGPAGGNHVDLVLGTRTLVVRPARRYAVGPHGQGRHHEVLGPVVGRASRRRRPLPRTLDDLHGRSLGGGGYRLPARSILVASLPSGALVILAGR